MSIIGDWGFGIGGCGLVVWGGGPKPPTPKPKHQTPQPQKK